MKFQVSVLSDKGVKKVVLTVVSDRYEEERGGGRNALLYTHETHVRFYSDKGGFWPKEYLVASVLLNSSYVIEEVSSETYS